MVLNNRGRKKTKNGRKKATFFVMSPDGFFSNFVFRVFELPLLRNAKKKRLDGLLVFFGATFPGSSSPEPCFADSVPAPSRQAVTDYGLD
jgi:hypothetical protein